MQTNQNFPMVSGDTKNIAVTITNSDNTAVNLSGATVKWLLHYFGTTKVSKTTGAGITITDATAGKVNIALAPADTSALVGEYSQELEVTDASGNVSTVMTGKVTIEKGYIV